MLRGGEGAYRRWRRGSWDAELKEETLRLSWWSRPRVFWIEPVTCARFCFDGSSGRSPPCTPLPEAAAAATAAAVAAAEEEEEFGAALSMAKSEGEKTGERKASTVRFVKFFCFFFEKL